MIRFAVCLIFLVPLYTTPGAAKYPPEFRETYKKYTELMDQGKERAAIPYARKALEVAVNSDAFNDEARGKLAFNLGYVLYLDHQLAASADAFGQAIEFFDKAGGNRKLKADALFYRGMFYQILMRHDEAQVELEQALELLTGPGRDEQLARAGVLEVLVWVEIAQRRNHRADDYAAEAYSISKKVLGDRHPRTLFCLLALSAANYKRGDHTKAREQLARALELAEQTGMAERGTKAGPMQFSPQELIQFHRRAALLYGIMDRSRDAEYHKKIMADLREGIPPPDRRVKPIKRQPPSYPDEAARKGVIGWVLIEFTVRPDGSTADVRVIDSAPDGYFEHASIRAVKRWKYEVLLENGKPREVKNVRTMIQFRLER